jgi:hypothetical protein
MFTASNEILRDSSESEDEEVALCLGMDVMY